MAKTPKIPLPENEYNFFQNLLNHPITDERYDDLVARKVVDPRRSRNRLFEIAKASKAAPHVVFGEKESRKGLVQGVKTKLVMRGIIEVIENGDPGKRAVVRILKTNISRSTSNMGRKIQKARVAA